MAEVKIVLSQNVVVTKTDFVKASMRIKKKINNFKKKLGLCEGKCELALVGGGRLHRLVARARHPSGFAHIPIYF